MTYTIRFQVDEALARRSRQSGPAECHAVARPRWRRCFAFSLALRLLARIVLLDLVVFFTCAFNLDRMAYSLAASSLTAQPSARVMRSAPSGSPFVDQSPCRINPAWHNWPEPSRARRASRCPRPRAAPSPRRSTCQSASWLGRTTRSKRPLAPSPHSRGLFGSRGRSHEHFG